MNKDTRVQFLNNVLGKCLDKYNGKCKTVTYQLKASSWNRYLYVNTYQMKLTVYCFQDNTEKIVFWDFDNNKNEIALPSLDDRQIKELENLLVETVGYVYSNKSRVFVEGRWFSWSHKIEDFVQGIVDDNKRST